MEGWLFNSNAIRLALEIYQLDVGKVAIGST